MLDGPTKRTTSPIVTGTSVLGVKYAGGVLLAADTLGSYGGLARFKDLRRIREVGSHTLLGASGEYSDFQEILKMLETKSIEEYCIDDGRKMTAKELQAWMSRVMYQRRNKQNPLYNSLVIAGFDNGESVLGYVDLIGTTFSDNYMSTGYGSHIALPLLRRDWREDMTEAEARELLENSMRVLYYRDCRTINRISVAKVDATGCTIDEPYCMETKWDYASFVKDKAGGDTGGSW